MRFFSIELQFSFSFFFFYFFFRTIEPDVVGERIAITDEEKPVLYQLEKERRQKVWEYRPGVEIPKVWNFSVYFVNDLKTSVVNKRSLNI